MAQIDRIAGLEAEYVLPGLGRVIAGKAAVERNFQAIRQMYG